MDRAKSGPGAVATGFNSPQIQPAEDLEFAGHALVYIASWTRSLRPCRKSLGRDLTPKVLANFSPGFLTLGQSASIELLTLKEFRPVP